MRTHRIAFIEIRTEIGVSVINKWIRGTFINTLICIRNGQCVVNGEPGVESKLISKNTMNILAIESGGVDKVDGVVVERNILIEAAAYPYWVVREPSAGNGIIPPGAR